MATQEERLQVLKMVESGLVSAAEAIELLDVLGRSTDAPPTAIPSGTTASPSRLRVRVTDMVTGHQKVDISLPWDLATVGMSMGARFTPRDIDIDLEDVVRAVETGAEGKVMEVVDEAEGERVEIFVD
jgi:hypothetical protein